MPNKHLLVLMLNPERQVTPNAAAAVDNLYDYANAIIKVQMPAYFYAAWTACHLAPANKVDPDDLPEGIIPIPDCRPVNIGSTKRRLITQSYFDDGL